MVPMEGLHLMRRRKSPRGLHGGWRASAHAGSTLLLTVIVAAGLGLSSDVAGAAPPPVIVTLNPPTSTSPYLSGQLVEVEVAANTVLRPGARLTIEECSAASVHRTPAHYDCDTRTRQKHRFVADPDGSANYQGYPIYALPDIFTLHETHHHRPVCNLVHACVLLVGWDIDDAHHEVWSLPFFVSPEAGDTGTDPGSGTPEVPYVLVLPIVAVAMFGGSVLLRRRRSVSRRPG